MFVIVESKYALVEWVGEDTMSVVCALQVEGGQYRIGSQHPVKISQGTFEALMLADGELCMC